MIRKFCILVFLIFWGLLAVADDNQPEPKRQIVTPFTFVSEYIREIGELNRITTEMGENIPKEQNEIFTHLIYYSEKIQLALATDINMLSKMRLGEDPKSDIPELLEGVLKKKAGFQVDFSSIASEALGADYSNPEVVDQIRIDAQRMPKLRAQNDNLDEMIYKEVTVLVFDTLVDPNGDGRGGTSKLLITKEERDGLLAQLRHEFGDKLDGKGFSPWFLSSGQVLYAAIKEHKGSDEFPLGTDKH
jgi:hypothetical protein